MARAAALLVAGVDVVERDHHALPEARRIAGHAMLDPRAGLVSPRSSIRVSAVSCASRTRFLIGMTLVPFEVRLMVVR